MDDEQLIALVRQYPALYDILHAKYMDTQFKFKIWKLIANQLKVDLPLCKARWYNIRDNYRRSLKTTTTRSGHQRKRSHYKFAQQLGFLIKHFDYRKRKLHIEHQEPVKEENIYVEIENVDENIEESEMCDEDESSSHSITEKTPDIRFSGNNQGSNECTLTLTPPQPQQTVPQEADSLPLVNYVVGHNANQTKHPVDAFLDGIAPTLRTLTPYYLNLAKSEIFATVQQYEMKMLMQQELGDNRSYQ